eukprot:366889-Prymnesium_polylepis.2
MRGAETVPSAYGGAIGGGVGEIRAAEGALRVAGRRGVGYACEAHAHARARAMAGAHRGGGRTCGAAACPRRRGGARRRDARRAAPGARGWAR